MCFFAKEERAVSNEELAQFLDYGRALLTSGLFAADDSLNNIKFASFSGVSPTQVTNIFKSIASEGDFNIRHVYQEVDWFFRMGIPPVYFKLFNDSQITAHLRSLIAGKRFAQSMGTAEDLFVRHTNEGHRFWIVPATYAHSVKVETEIESLVDKMPAGLSVSLAYMFTKGTFNPAGKYQLSMYYLDQPPFAETKVAQDEVSLKRVASEHFLRERSFEIVSRYQELLDASKGVFRPITRKHPVSVDGFTPVSIALHHDRRTSFLLKSTEVLRHSKIRCSRKFIQSFANGLVVYTYYLQTQNAAEVDGFLADLQQITLIPGSSMKQLFLNSNLSVEEYSYAASVRKFVYYFLNQRNEEFDQLAKALQGDPLNLARLNLLATRLHREAVSRDRITQGVIDEVRLFPKIFADFVRCCQQKPSYNKELHDEIAKSAKNELNVQICRAFLMFNSKLLKTNFWKPSKAALAFSLDASFVEQASYPENPYVIFFVVAQEFQGFHIRFRDISRGGIRVIKSPNATMFQKNLEGQFSETYNLALTQNLKNKDIPEFGSKGTVLLFKDAQENVQLAFKKYVSGLLDLLVIHEDDRIVDHYKRPELLFLGPDENTADLMEWAARFAQSRGYKYWKAFTTGKPAILGGIPHDVHGMTTNGVHAYVVGVLQKLGLKEEEVTKFQTGGPDGDLGSNEILISKDKTTGIVDGSGVIYDPKGLNREELRRLARRRVMISEFDAKLLNDGGFRVLTGDKDIVLPHGEKVASGMTFRNEFQFHPLSKADLFVPCGGRPAAISLSDVKKVFDGGVPKWKIVVEGANLFLTQDARMVLEQAGVVLYKDASANKGGVTSSSLEVLAALTMTDDEHGQHMQVKDKANPPPFYGRYVEQVQASIIENAQLEFECIWREHQRTGIHRCILTDKISEKINQLNDACAKSKLFENQSLRTAVMTLAVPKVLQELVPVKEIVDRVPENYSRALFSAFLAARFVYHYGLNAHDFAFFEYVSTLLEKPPGSTERN